MVRPNKIKKPSTEVAPHHELPNEPKERLHDQLVTFWGTRGTMPVNGPGFIKYGGSTICVEVRKVCQNSATSIICDAGSGIINCGEQALLRGDRNFHVFLSHYHYDHILGLLKFAPLFRNNTQVHLYGLAKAGLTLREMFSRFFCNPFFPLELKQLPSYENLHFHELNGLSGVMVEGSRIDIQQLNHPQQAIGFRIWSQNLDTSIVYATDHEHGTQKDDELCEFAQNTTLLLYDSTFCHEDYNEKFVGWGHSTALRAAEVAQRSGAKWLGLFHHDPDAEDETLEKSILPEAQFRFANSFLCQQGTTISLRSLAEKDLALSIVDNPRFHLGLNTKNRKIG